MSEPRKMTTVSGTARGTSANQRTGSIAAALSSASSTSERM